MTLGILLLGLTLFIITKLRKLKLFEDILNAVKIMLFISDTKHYIAIKLYKTAGSIHLFKIAGAITSEDVKLKRNRTQNIIEIDWKEINVTLNRNKVNLSKSVTIKF